MKKYYMKMKNYYDIVKMLGKNLTCKFLENTIYYTTSTHMGLPPEFKHINEGRKRN